MIKIKNTENYTGVTISGDYDDLYNLVDAFHEITVDEFDEKNTKYYNVSIRVLGICYDIRHSYQGDREVELVDNNMDRDKMKFLSIITPRNNLYYKCNILYPEMIYGMLALNELIKLRIRNLTKEKLAYMNAFDRKVIWDSTITTIRAFQSEFIKCIMDTISEASHNRWLNLMNNKYISIEDMALQYLDLQNLNNINMDKEKRFKNITIMTKRIAEYNKNKEYLELKEAIRNAAIEFDCSENDVRYKYDEFPDEIDW